MLSDEALDEAEDDLGRCLPSWVTEDQIRNLLTNSNGDIAEAASHFYEHELDLYEQANACNPLVSASQPSLLDNHSALNQDSRPSPHVIDGGAKIRTMPSVSSPKNRVSGVGNRPRKKGRTSLSIESSGCKQSTITKYFGPVLSSVSKDDERSIITAADRHPKEMYKEELDQFLQIIHGSLPINTAATLLEKARGSIDVAVELYYSDSSYRSVNEKRLSSAEVSMQGGLSSSCGSNVVQVSEETANLSTLFSQGTSSEDTTEGRVSLPIGKYSPVEHACWKTGQPAPYLHLARTFDLVEREKGKIKTTAMLCNMFRSLVALSPEDVLPAVYLCTNKIAPAHENMELNIGGGLVVSALEEACRTSRSRIREMYKTYGDLGDVAQECRRTQSLIVQPRPISIRDFFYALRKISVEIGSGSASRKKNHVVQLMCSCREMEMKFLVRTLVRNLRIGAMMKTILPALAQAVVLNNNSAALNEGSSESLKSQLQCISAEIAEAYNVLPNLDLLIPLLLSEGIHFSASNLPLVPGTPIPPMLARITNGVNQVLKLFEGRAFTCEYKYDGQRAQIHKLKNGSMKVFSRQMKESTSRFPDLMCIIEELCRSEVLTFILDAEIVAVNRKNGIKLLSFQDLSSREKGSKISSITVDSIKVDICIFIFDIMLLNGEQLLALPLRERRKYLKEIFCKEKLGYLQLAKEITVEAEEACLSDQRTVTKMDSFFRDACSSSCEGIMVKSLDVDAGYSASRRTESWLKVKRDYVEGLGDSLDLVPIGAWHGNGRKAGWYSPFLMACYNPDAEEFQSVCRVMSGFSDSFYAEMKEFFSGAKLLLRKPPYYQTDESPDLWFSPELVWEIRGADLTISPVHHAAVGLVHPSRGISMRLPRYIRSNSDRKPEDCSTAADIAYMFKSQTRKMEVKRED